VLRHKALVAVWLLATLLRVFSLRALRVDQIPVFLLEGPKELLASPYTGVILQLASHNWRRRKNVGVLNAGRVKRRIDKTASCDAAGNGGRPTPAAAAVEEAQAGVADVAS